MQRHESHLEYDIDGIDIKLVTFFICYDSKEDLLEMLSRDAPSDEAIEISKQAMLWDERPDVSPAAVEVGWRYLSDTHSTELTMEQKQKLIKEFIPDLRDVLQQGYNGHKPQEGIILCAYPHGHKDMFDWSTQSAEEGKRQRALFAKRVGFGDIKGDDFVWGRYDDNGRVKPL